MDTGLLNDAGEDFAYLARRAHRMRAEAMAQAFAGVIGALKALARRVARMPSAAIRARQTARELHALSDHILKDLGLRRDQINCVARQVPC